MSLKAVLHRVKRSFDRFWDNVLAAINVLWIARVSALSVIAGAVLFVGIPPVRDTFLEMRADRLPSWDDLGSWSDPAFWDDLGRWFFFFCTAVLFWALPVHYAARRNLRHDPFFGDDEVRKKLKPTRADFWGEWIPRILAAVCLLVIAIGAFMAQSALRVVPQTEYSPRPGNVRQLEAVPQPVAAHQPEGARRSVSGNQYDDIAQSTKAIGWLALLSSVALLVFLQKRKLIFGGTSEQLGTVLLLALLCAFVFLLFIPASKFNLARAPLIPLLIGGWIPLFAVLAYYGRVTRLPLILVFLIVLEIVAVFFADHTVRDLWAAPGDSVSRTPPETGGARFVRPSLNAAIDNWRAINCPDGRPCPRPIVVAASGGASRAGFFTAATLGYLLDQSRGNKEMNDFRDQLFAISSVSGSSTGAAFFAAALRAENKDGANPCKRPDESGLVYFSDRPLNWQQCMEQLLAGDFISPTLFSYVFKDAAQGVWATVGPFLGIASPDDRAAVLEKSWEKRFCQITNHDPLACENEQFEGMEAPFIRVIAHSDQDRAERKWHPLLFFNSTDADTGRRVIVSSVLSHMVSGDKVSDDKIFGDSYDLHELLSDTPLFKERPLGYQAASRSNDQERDISLSTAALLSARFPLISPPGVVFNRDHKVVARLIDGGYFENFGATTALELARRLKQAKLDPFIVEITNDPELLVGTTVQAPRRSDSRLCSVGEGFDPLCEADPPINEIQQFYWFSDVRGPLSGLFGSRNAHGGQALRNLAGFAGPGTAFCPPPSPSSNKSDRAVSFVHILVHPQYQISWWRDLFGKPCTPVEVPLNWWLSKPVQRYLDKEIENNDLALQQVLKVMVKRTGPSTPALPN